MPYMAWAQSQQRCHAFIYKNNSNIDFDYTQSIDKNNNREIEHYANFVHIHSH